MELLDRYLNAIKHWLPENVQNDLLPELEDDLRSQIEEREAAAGRPLSEAELSSLLKERGHPVLVATRLLPQQHLIGPRWYPIWRLGVRSSFGSWPRSSSYCLGRSRRLLPLNR